jgi:hypothetical protein
MEMMRSLIEISTRLENLNNLYSVWQFNHYLRVTYVSPTWLVIWDHRHNPPERHDFKDVGDHKTVCRLTAEHLQKLAVDERA